MTTLNGYFRRFFVPKARKTLHRETIKQYATAVRRFVAFNQCDPRLEDVTAERIDEFQRWAVKGGAGYGAAYKYAACLRQVMRSHVPKRFPKRYRRNKREVEIVPGSLREYLHRHYVLGHAISSSYFEQLRISDESFASFLGVEPMLDLHLTDHGVNQWLVWLCDEGRSPSTLRSKRNALLCLWRSAWEDELVPHAPRRIRKVRVGQRIPRAWRPDEISRLIAAAVELREPLPYILIP